MIAQSLPGVRVLRIALPDPEDGVEKDALRDEIIRTPYMNDTRTE